MDDMERNAFNAMLAACEAVYDALEHEDSTKYEEDVTDPLLGLMRKAIANARKVEPCPA